MPVNRSIGRLDGSYLPGRFKGLFKDEKGQAMVEYALILVLITLVAIVALSLLGGSVNTTLSKANSAITP